MKFNYLSMGSASLKLLAILVGVLRLGTNGESLVEEACKNNDRDALLAFKQGFQNHLSSFASWNIKEDCCKWRGVGCNNKTGHVTTLDLHSLHPSEVLQGELRDSLLDLPYLSYLDLSLNDFHQIQIPEFIGSLSRLRYLNLSHANFKGTIPDHLGNLSHLIYLDLSGNDYSLRANDLAWLDGLSSLKFLDLGGVDLSNSLDWLGAINMLPSLVELRLFACKLNNLPQSLLLANFTSLEILDLSYNNFYSPIPRWLFHIGHSLKSLNLTRCQLQGSIPDAFLNMTSLALLDFSYNNLSSSIPPTLGNMTSLSLLDLSFNNLEGQIPATLGLTQELHQFRHSSLRELHLSYNQLNGSLERIFVQLSELHVLEVASNSFHGKITEVQLQNFSSLRVLDLSRTNLVLNVSSNWNPVFQLQTINLRECTVGQRFPQWLQNQKEIMKIDISDTGITGTVPDWFWNLSSLIKNLDLSFNGLRGKVPDLSSRTGLSTLDLSYNFFQGPIPHFPLRVRSVLLAGNYFTGPLSHLCDMLSEGNTLNYLDLNYNYLEGQLPDCWTYGKDLFFLGLLGNFLSGQVPESFGQLVHLEVLFLGLNKFSELPLSLMNCKSLLHLHVGYNLLSGGIPAWIGTSFENLRVLSLRDNNFEGNIPLQLCQLKNIVILDLASNSLSGDIPRCINNFQSLIDDVVDHSYEFYYHRYYISYPKDHDQLKRVMRLDSQRDHFMTTRLDLSNNHLTGEIPREVSNLKGLMRLNLSRNNLRGMIPCDVGSMKSLEALDLSMNQLSYAIPASMTDLHSLEIVNFSCNNLSGKIPSSGQFQFFGQHSYLGNHNLCGPPLARTCSSNQSFAVTDCSSVEQKNGNEEEEEQDGHGFKIPSFYISMWLGFVTGFWGFWFTLLLNRTWRYAYLRFLDNMGDKIYVIVMVSAAGLRRKFRGEAVPK